MVAQHSDVLGWGGGTVRGMALNTRPTVQVFIKHPVMRVKLVRR